MSSPDREPTTTSSFRIAYVPISVLDLATVGSGSTPAKTLADLADLAQLVEDLG